MLILPAIDIYEGKCIRLRQGNYDFQTLYSDSPYSVAQSFADVGFTNLHVVDLEGAKEKKIVNWKTIEAIASISSLSVEVGGGIRTRSDIEQLLNIGVQRVIIGSIAVHQPNLVSEWINHFGNDKIVIGIDVKDEKVAIHGWKEQTNYSADEFITLMKSRGAKVFICTDISRDGMLQGPNISFYKHLLQHNPDCIFIASGGVTTLDDVIELKNIQIHGVIIGKALYEGTIKINELASYRQ